MSVAAAGTALCVDGATCSGPAHAVIDATTSAELALMHIFVAEPILTGLPYETGFGAHLNSYERRLRCGPKRVRIIGVMDRFNYVMPEWLSELLDSKIEISSMGALLGTLSDVAEVCAAGGGLLRKRDVEHEDISTEHLRALIRYAANQMTFMGSRPAAGWADVGVQPNEVVIHSEWLSAVAEAAWTMSYNIGQFGGFPIPVVFDSADDFRRHLDEQAGFAAKFHDLVVTEALAAEQSADQPAPPVVDSSS